MTPEHRVNVLESIAESVQQAINLIEAGEMVTLGFTDDRDSRVMKTLLGEVSDRLITTVVEIRRLS